MTLDKIIVPKLEIDLFGEKWNCEFKLRNFAVLKERLGITEHQLLSGLMNNDTKYIAYGIWASTIVFAPFDETDPLKVEKTMELKDIFNLTMAELQVVSAQVVKAMEAYLPKPTEKEKAEAEKKPKKAVKKAAKKKKSMK